VQQKQLEDGLRKYNAATPNRWDMIAANVPGKTTRECMLRFQDLCRKVKAAKAAPAAK
jgi:hypothetical protein